MAGRRAGDKREPALEMAAIQRHGEGSERAGMSIYHARGNHRIGGKAEIGGGLTCERAKRRTGRPEAPANAGKALLGQFSEPDQIEKFPIPAGALKPGLATIRPLADSGAQRARIPAAGTPGKPVGQIEEMCSADPAFWQVLPDPLQLGHLHLGRNGAAGGPQPLMAGCIDFAGLGGGAVIGP